MHSNKPAAMVTVVEASSGHGCRRRAAGDAWEGWRRSLEAGGARSGVGATWCCLEQAGEDAGSLQTCSEAGKTIGVFTGRPESTGVLLLTVRFSGDGRSGILLTDAARRASSSLEMTGQRRS